MLAYHKEPCAAEDLQARFILHVIPADAGDLPPEHRPHGFENVGFYFREYGARLGEACVALAPLPEYADRRPPHRADERMIAARRSAIMAGP